MKLKKEDCENILQNFLSEIEDLRVLYMSLILQNEQMVFLLSENKPVISTLLNSKGELVFGERFFNDPTFYTNVDTNECIKKILDVEEILNDITRNLVLRLTAIHENYYRNLVKYFFSQTEPKLSEENQYKKIIIYEKGSAQHRLILVQELFGISCSFTSEYQALNFLFRVRNSIAHNNGFATEKFFIDGKCEDDRLSPYRKHSNKSGTIIELNKKIVLSQYDFSELIHLVALVGKKMFSCIFNECPQV